MPKVFPCYAPPDRELARELAAFLERGAGIEVLLEEGEMVPGSDLIAKVEEGLAADVVLVLLSPDSSPARWVLERWKSVFWDQAAEVGTALATVLCRDARFPELLRRRNFFDLRQNGLGGFRSIKRWLMSLSPAPQQPPFTPAHQPSLAGCEAELETLCVQLADRPGSVVLEGPAGSGKTALALAFARHCREDFDGLLWLTCGSRPVAALAGDLAAQLGARLDRDLESNLNELRHLCARHRCLLVLDDATPEAAALLAPRGRTSLLVTTRAVGLHQSVSAASIAFPPHNPDRATIADCIRVLDRAAQRLLAAACACAPSGFPLEMAARTADAEDDETREIATRFVKQGVFAPLDEACASFLIPAFVRERAGLRGDSSRWSCYHAQAAASLFGEPAGAQDLAAYWPELQHAFAWAIEADWALASTLARRAIAWTKAQDRLAEAFEILAAWHRAGERQGDLSVLNDCAWEQSWILQRWGRDREAQQKDEERIHLYANQMSFRFD